MTTRWSSCAGPPRVEAALVLDDADAAVGAEHKEAWQTWLRLAGLLGRRPAGTHIGVRSAVSGGGALAEPAALTSLPRRVDVAWSTVIAQASALERELVLRLAETDLAVPELGHEVDGLPLGPSWPDQRITVRLDLTPDEQSDLAGLGWTVVEDDVDAVRAALLGGGR